MAVTPVGNPYVESSDLVANYPGASEALAERIDVVGVNPFADSAARATAIPSPVEGQMASLNDDDKVYRYNGSDWIAVGTTPGLTLITSNTFSAVSTVSVDNCFNSDYANYLIILQTTSPSVPFLTYRMRASSTDNTATEYDQQRLQTSGASTFPTQTSNQTSFGGWGLGTSSGRLLFSLELSNPQVADRTIGNYKWARNNAGGVDTEIGAIVHTTATQFDGISFTVTSSNISGTIRIYGYKNS
jgi:hypothetical protein